MPTDLDPIAVLRRTDPAAAIPIPDRPATDELVAIPDGPARHRPAARRVALVAAILLVVALAGAAAVVAGGRDDHTPVATAPDPNPSMTDPSPSTTTPAPQSERPAMLPLAEPEPARDHLLALADRTAADTAPIDDGPVAYQRFVTWQHETFDVPDRPSFAHQSKQREVWIVDGVGTIEDSPGPEPRVGEVVQMDPDPALAPVVETQTFDHYLDPADLPDDPGIVDRYLQVEFGAASDFTYPLERAGTLLGDRPRSGADRAAILRRLAEIEEVQYRGEVVDRAGRPSLAFSAQTDSHGGITEVVLLLDPATGALNGREDHLLEGGADMALGEPIVTYFQVWIDRADVGAVGERPA